MLRRNSPDRLSAVMRPFPRVLDLGTPGPALTQVLGAARAGVAGSCGAGLRRRGPGGGCGWRRTKRRCHSRRRTSIWWFRRWRLQGVNDLPGALVQIRRALAPDGLFMGCLLGGQTLQELRLAFAEAEEAITGGVSPRVAPFADLRDMGGLLQRAGFALPVTDVDTITVRYASIFGLLRDLRAMGATNALVARDRRPLRRAVLMRAAEIYQSRFADPDGRLRATFEIRLAVRLGAAREPAEAATAGNREGAAGRCAGRGGAQDLEDGCAARFSQGEKLSAELTDEGIRALPERR